MKEIVSLSDLTNKCTPKDPANKEYLRYQRLAVSVARNYGGVFAEWMPAINWLEEFIADEITEENLVKEINLNISIL